MLIVYLTAIPSVLIVFAIIIVTLGVLSGQPWLIVIILKEYFLEFLVTFLSFLITLRIGSNRLHENLIARKGLLKTSFSFSLFINSIILLAFSLMAKLNSNDVNGLLFLIIYLSSIIIMTFSFGLLISYIIKRNINMVN